jgi:hypothetical protein
VSVVVSYVARDYHAEVGHPERRRIDRVGEAGFDDLKLMSLEFDRSSVENLGECQRLRNLSGKPLPPKRLDVCRLALTVGDFNGPAGADRPRIRKQVE